MGTKKKAAPKKVATRKTEALTEFEGDEIMRDGDSISFGCGAVEVSRKDILIVADAFEDKNFLKLANTLADNSNGSEISFSYVDEFIKAAELFRPEYKKALNSLETLCVEAENHKDAFDIISIKPDVLRAIAG